jgi:hypothetical protein
LTQYVSDAGNLRVSMASTAAGGAGSIATSAGNLYLAAGGANNVLIRVNGTDEVQVDSSAMFPFANDGSALGKTDKGWADLHGATGFTLNIANGNWVAEHSSGVLNVSTGDIQIGGSSVMTAAEAAAGYQPLDSDLTSWAGVTRASGFDTFAATPSSANLRSLVTDETGSGGALVFATGPTIASPIITTSPTAAGSTWTDLGTVTTADINGGTIDGTVIGGASAAAITGTSINATSVIITSGDPFVRLTDADTGADHSLNANNATGSFSYFADFNGEVANSAHDWYVDDTGTVRMRLSASAFYVPAVGTTGSAANAFLDSGSSPTNQLLRSTSSRRYKTNITELTEADYVAVQRMRPIKYTSLAPADDPNRWHVGLVAEDMAEIDRRLVNYDKEGRPDGVQYDRVSALLLGYVKTLERRIRDLEQCRVGRA